MRLTTLPPNGTTSFTRATLSSNGTTSFMWVRCKGLNEGHLTSAISFEVRTGCRNMYYRAMRFSNFLHSNLLEWSSKSNQLAPQNLLDELGAYSTAIISERSKFLNKVSVLIGYDSIQDLIDQEEVRKASFGDTDGMADDYDFTLARIRFPCIVSGDSSAVELYDEVANQHYQVNPLILGRYTTSLPCSVQSNWTDETTDGETKSKAQTHYKNPSAYECIGRLDSSLSTEPILDKTIRCLPNATNKQCHQLEDSGFHTVRKLLHHFPRTYADLQNAQGTIEDGHYLIFVGSVRSSRGIRAGSSFSFLEVVVGCDISSKEPISEINCNQHTPDESKMIYLHLKKFFRGTRFTYRPFLNSIQSKYKEGDRVYVSGKVKKMHSINHFEMREYNIDRLEETEEHHAHVEKRPYPLYPSKAGLNPCFFREIISRALKILPTDIDPLPIEIAKEFNLPDLSEAYNGIHRPMSLTEADLARRRLIFDEFFYLQLGRLFQMLEAIGSGIEKEQLLDKYKNHELYSVPVEEWTPITKKLLYSLPFSLTSSQLNAVSEIIYDLKRPVPMNRLLQGDVGCGKTVVAFLACMEVIGSGFQAAFMVPTELLAVQHYDHLLSLLENFSDDWKPSVALLTGSTPSKQSYHILKGLQTGDIAMVIGTHSLIADKVEFSNLRIAVVDEQHRFGVIQRGRLNSKLYSSSASLRSSLPLLDVSLKDTYYMAPHVLAMSATPIPRTLALALFGDMSLTQITDLPPGRTPVETLALEGNETGLENVYQMMQDELVGGGKVYLVYPIIDESEQFPQLRAASVEFEHVSDKFKNHQCGLLHGRMKSEEKDEALRKFRSGETQILLATQVIEIGVDIPDASMMVVMNAERFGIAQLHQLRGRVGRGQRKSKCVFLSSTSAALDRLKVLEKSSDGFYLANADLLLRGPGNLLGKQQSGHIPEFPIARLEIDGNILQEAHLAALKVLIASNDLEKYPRLKAELSIRQPLCLLGD